MFIQDFVHRLDHVKKSSGKYTARCPAHDDQHNSLSIATGEDGRILVKCHAGCSLEEIVQAMSLQISDLFAAKDTPAKRARSEVKMQKCKFDEIVYLYAAESGKILYEVVRYQYEDGSKTFRQRRKTSDGYAYTLDGVQPVLYRLPELRREIESGSGVIVICEGEKDADALANLGFVSTTSPMGAGKWRDDYTDALMGARAVYVIPDNDKPGRAHALRVAGALEEAGVSVLIVDVLSLCPTLPHKGDISDVLAKQGDAVVPILLDDALSRDAFEAISRARDAQDGLPPYRFDTAAAYIAQRGFLRDIERCRQANRLSTGFSLLDKQLDGRLYAGLYVIGSVSSLGKTAFCLQMADHIAMQGRDVLFFTLEMSRLEMVSRSLLRLLFMQDGDTKRNIGHVLYGSVPQETIEKVMALYTDSMGKHISFIEGGYDLGVDTVVSLANQHVNATGQRPVVFVDYLQILKPEDVHLSDKQATDRNVIALKRLSRDLDIPVIAVSSFNRQNYTEEVNLSSFKESGAIEYSADFVLGLQARGISESDDLLSDTGRGARMVSNETKKAKQADPRPIEAVTLKNRQGPAWAKFELDFYAKQYYFAETGR